MKHCIIAKMIPEATAEDKIRIADEAEKLFSTVTSVEGISGSTVYRNCVARDNRYDLMIVIEMEKDALPAYDECGEHKRWKQEYGKWIASKAIFDYE